MNARFAHFAARLLAEARTRAATQLARTAADQAARWRNPAWLWPDVFKD